MKKLWRDRDGNVLIVRPSPRLRAEAAWRVESESMVDLTQEQAAELAEHISPTVRENENGTYTVRLLGDVHTVTPTLSWDDPNEGTKALEFAARIVASIVHSRKPKPKWHGLHPSIIAVLKEKGVLESPYTVTCEGRNVEWNEGRNPAALTISRGVYCASFATENDETGHLSTRSYDKVCSYEAFWEVALNG